MKETLEETLEETLRKVKEGVRITKLLREQLNFEMVFAPNGEEPNEKEKVMSAMFADGLVEIKLSQSRLYFVRILHQEEVIAVICGKWSEATIIQRSAGYEAKIFVKFKEGIQVISYCNMSRVTIWCGLREATWIEPKIIAEVERIFNGEGNQRWFSISPLSSDMEPLENFAAPKFLQQMTERDKFWAWEVGRVLFDLHKELSRLTEIK
jgi:hypothetical protein